MTHTEFVAAHRNGTLRVTVDPALAARYLSASLLLPLAMLPVLGIGVGLAITGMVWSGLALIALGIIVPRLIKRSAPRFLLMQALQDEKFYLEMTRSGIILTNGR